MASEVLPVNDNSVHEPDPLALLRGHDGDLRRVLHGRPARVDLADGEDAAVGDAEVRAREQEGHVRLDGRVRREDVVERRDAVEGGVLESVVDSGLVGAARR